MILVSITPLAWRSWAARCKRATCSFAGTIQRLSQRPELDTPALGSNPFPGRAPTEVKSGRADDEADTESHQPGGEDESPDRTAWT